MRMTTDEIKVVTFLITALLVGASAKYYRSLHPRPIISTPAPQIGKGYPSSRRW
jgi:hypothetical protein